MHETLILKIQTLGQLLDGPTTIDWIVDKIIPPQTSTFFAGPSGVGKTWLTLELAIAIASGQDWLNVFPVKQGPVLIIDEENSDLLLRIRLMKLLEQKNLDVNNLPIYFAVGQMANLSPNKTRNGDYLESNDYKKIYNTVKEIQPVLTVFDSLTRVHRQNENDSSEMSTLFVYVKKLMNDLDTSVLFTHHFTKAGKNGDGSRVRGSGDIGAFADTMVLIEEFKKMIRMKHDKARWDKPVESFTVTLESNGDAISIIHGEFGYSDVWRWLRPLLPLSRKEIIARAKKDKVGFAERKIDSALAWRSEYEYLEKEVEGREVTYKLSEKKEAVDQAQQILDAASEYQEKIEEILMK